MHISETDAEQFATEFVNLDGLIDRFAHSLAPVSTAPDAHTASKLLLVHTLACVAYPAETLEAFLTSNLCGEA